MYKLNEDKLIKFLEESHIVTYNIVYPEGLEVKKAVKVDIRVEFKPKEKFVYPEVWFVVHGYNDKHYLNVGYTHTTHNYRISENLFERILELKPNVEFLDKDILDQICDKTKDIEEN